MKAKPSVIGEVPYKTRGMTAMRDAILDAIGDHKEKKTSKVDRSYLMYVITDGQDNASLSTIARLAETISKLDDSWTICALVPSQQDAHYAKMGGIPAGNIQVWDVASEKGFEEVGRTMASSYASYSSMRSHGVRSSATLFKVNAADIKVSDVKQNLTEIDGSLFHAQKDYVIKDLAEKVTNRPYVKGTVYYELTKKEVIQAQKEIVIISRKSDKRYGGKSARDLLGLPDYEVKVAP